MKKEQIIRILENNEELIDDEGVHKSMYDPVADDIIKLMRDELNKAIEIEIQSAKSAMVMSGWEYFRFKTHLNNIKERVIPS